MNKNPIKNKILLIQPAIEDFYSTDCRTQPLGLAYLGAAVKRDIPGVEVVLYDALSSGKKRTLPWPPEFEYLKKYYGHVDKSPFALFHNYYRFGKTIDEMKSELSTHSPFLIGISALFTPYYRTSIEAAQLCRKIFPNAVIVMGGGHATIAPESFFEARNGKNSVCDYIFYGEAEISFTQFTKAILNGDPVSAIPGVIASPSLAEAEEIQNRKRYFEKNEMDIHRPDIASLPHPDFSGLNQKDYQFEKKPMAFLLTSRSCPHQCSFCAIHSVFGSRYRRRKNSDILAEIKKRIEENICHIDIEDDSFAANRKETISLLDEIVQNKIPVTFSAMNGITYWHLDIEILEKMKKAGFSSLNLSLVSRGKRTGENANRPTDLDRFSKIVTMAKDLDFSVVASYIIGMPGQTLEEMTSNLLYIASLPALLGASPYYFTPGTPDYRKWRESASVRLASEKSDPFFAARLTALDLETDDFNRDDIYTLFRLSRLVNHLKRGIDLGYASDHPFYGPALDALEKKEWSAENGTSRIELPFSKNVASILALSKLEVSGFKSKNKICFETR